MTIHEIRELLELFNASGVGELEIEREGVRIRIRKAGLTPEYTVSPVGESGQPRETAAGNTPGTSPASESGQITSGQIMPGQIMVKSPIVGTYYDAASPGAEPFVNVGDAVAPGQILCIIESMKLMNEIEAEIAGVVTAKLVENGRAVEYGAELFSIRPR